MQFCTVFVQKAPTGTKAHQFRIEGKGYGRNADRHRNVNMKFRITAVMLASLAIVCASLAGTESNSVRSITVTNLGSTAAEVSSPAIATNAVEHLTAVAAFAPVPVPEPSEKALHFYHSGIIWWLVSVGWSWFVPALILFTGFSGWLGRQAKRIGRWEMPATFAFVLLYFFVVCILSLPLNYFLDYVRLHDYGLSNQTFARWLDHSLKGTLVNVVIYGTTLMVLRELIRRSPRRWWVYSSLFVGLVVFFMAFIYPIWINPLFNRFGPIRDKRGSGHCGLGPAGRDRGCSHL